MLIDVASQAITVHTLSKYRVDIACLSEVRLPHFGSSEVIINPGSEQKYWQYHYDASDNSGQNGNVAIVMSDKAHSALIEWKPTVWPMPVLRSLPKHDMFIIGVDWNAHIGHNAAAMTPTIGKYGIGDRKHLVTWNSPDNQYFNRIDYILISHHWKDSVLDSRSYRGAETGNLHGSDHVMARAKIRIKLTTRKTASLKILQLSQTKKFGNSAFQTELLKHLNDTNINDFSGTANEYWSKLKECLRKSDTSTIGRTSRRCAGWVRCNCPTV
ncbi:unnamed protein product [Dracunculus medinensis]|uniref:Endo/exonuclease/phosphatase domain-containing protein n=1 Tax=Dracunculus medinensis TaxID=318479 RepID=A0A0N4UHP1_DRAME|nr:unnamed protein product [Dracunculus medinensis]